MAASSFRYLLATALAETDKGLTAEIRLIRAYRLGFLHVCM